MGPNALPVPQSRKGIVYNQIIVEPGYSFHHSPGDKTHNMFLRAYLPVVKNKVVLEIKAVPIEMYKMDTATVYERRTRHLDGTGIAAGDIYVSTIFQIIRDRKFPDIALGINLRTASGTKLSDARHTDSPGYYFDLSVGKDFVLSKEKNINLRLSFMTGFYSWQLNLENNKQNDAFLFGLGADLSYGKLTFSAAMDGYLGYFGDREMIVGNREELVSMRDKPIVFRSEIKYKYKKIAYKIGYQNGIHDFPYQSIRFNIELWL